MSLVYIISDLHLGHKNIGKFEPNRLFVPFESTQEHDDILIDRWNSRVTKRDLVFVLGDVAFTTEALQRFDKECVGRKILVRGNHDVLAEGLYHKIFEKIYGIFKYKGHWLSHAPIHPQELRGRLSWHGHVHSQSVPDNRYVNCCVEESFGYPRRFDLLLAERLIILDKMRTT